MIFIILSIILIAVLIILSAFFSGSEMALISIDRALVIDKARKGNVKAKRVQRLLEKPDHVISAIVIGNNIVNIFASILAGYVATELFGNIGIGIATVCMFFLVIFFSEATPKAFGRKNEKWALRSAKALLIFTKIFYPTVIIVKHFSNGMLKLLGENPSKKDDITEDKIMAMMRLGEEEGTIESDEREMVNDVFEFDETIADEVDMPLSKIEFLHQNDTIKKLITKSIETGFSRFPVYRKNYDDIVGMVHIKDALRIQDHNKKIKEIMRGVLKVDSRMKADDIVRKMKKVRTHIALVQDKKGKTIGLISMEDLIEEIFGDISDEHDPT
jgi:CBS domain containing-hemolysin-like protein